ncbi:MULTISPECIES: heptaprenyl diphosphate synthase component 1 [Salimicrobium]|uniref:Heptaprenyl diphosphate synthase component I n=3 Tax=Salimicrobium TaxID=351195 RepID=K2GC46_9BACI|nr:MULTISPECIES: heptaprenyl diphosphate synthase component 1 [Salimicrobium]APC65584.1 hypothetical protein AAV35_14170 [Salimicrobium jeotgali]EKE32598.1 heptaprenyl diphosphate synthase component I [Salimicrobium jeotgali]
MAACTERKGFLMEMNDLNSRITYYKEQISSYAYHPYLSKHIGEPAIDERKMKTYIHLFDHLPERKDMHDNYLLSVMFVQMALDTHDFVTVDNSNKEVDEVRKRQLTVLAGDFYSGLYYHLLSLINDLDFIQVLAKTIREVNEQKVRLYYGKHDSLTSYVQTYKNVETLLAYNVWCHFMPPGDCGAVVESMYVKGLNNWGFEKNQAFSKPEQSKNYAYEIADNIEKYKKEAYASFKNLGPGSSVPEKLYRKLDEDLAQEFN